jgi:hypothetical protein
MGLLLVVRLPVGVLSPAPMPAPPPPPALSLSLSLPLSLPKPKKRLKLKSLPAVLAGLLLVVLLGVCALPVPEPL